MLRNFLLPLLFVALNHAQDYFPIEVGNYWVFDRLDSTGIVGTDSLAISSMNRINGLDLFLMAELVSNSDSTVDTMTNYIESKGNDIHLYPDTSDPSMGGKFFQHAYQDGETWSNVFGNFTVQFVGRVAVPAGTFDSCYRVHNDSTLDGYWVFAPNVGLLQRVNDGFMDFALRAWSVPLPILQASSRGKKSPTKIYLRQSPQIRFGTGMFDFNGKSLGKQGIKQTLFRRF